MSDSANSAVSNKIKSQVSKLDVCPLCKTKMTEKHLRKVIDKSDKEISEAKKITVEGKSTISEDHDELLSEAANLIIETGQASVSLLQRRFRIGYSRAGRLIDELEALGIISGYSGSKAREVLVDADYVNNLFNK